MLSFCNYSIVATRCPEASGRRYYDLISRFYFVLHLNLNMNIQNRIFGSHLIMVDEVGSTNSELLEHADDHDHGTVLAHVAKQPVAAVINVIGSHRTVAFTFRSY